MALAGGFGPTSYQKAPSAPQPMRKSARLGGGSTPTSGCPSGSVEVSPISGGVGRATSCPPGATKSGLKCCKAQAAGGGISMPKITGGGPGGAAPAGGPLPMPTGPNAPGLTPLDPQAAYDPKIAEALQRQTGYATNLEQGSGRTMEVLTQANADQLEAQVAQARAAAAQAGIPFDEAAFRAQGQKSINAAMAQEKTAREAQLGQALQAQSSTAQGQAGERTQRLGLDLSRDVKENELGLQRYAEELKKYGIDVGAVVSKYNADQQAATAANNALLGFYSNLMGGMFNMFGNMGNLSMTNQQYYG